MLPGLFAHLFSIMLVCLQNRKTALIFAAESGQTAVAKLLVQAGVDLDICEQVCTGHTH